MASQRKTSKLRRFRWRICQVGALLKKFVPPFLAACMSLPGGWKRKDLPYFTGSSHAFPSGDKLVHGQRGEVVGPATGERTKSKGVKVLFPGNKGWIDLPLSDVCRQPCTITAGPQYPRP